MAEATFRVVQNDIALRAAKGRQTYGSDLNEQTPVDLLTYAYEEALDLALYLRAEIDRRNRA